MPAIDVLNGKHLPSILPYVCRRDGCMKTELYSGVGGTGRLPEKIQGPDDAGLLKQDVSGHTRIRITDGGKQAASRPAEIEEFLEKMR